jgi:hypothetical protein
MSRVLIIHRQRLGDIVATLPAARHLHLLGNEVHFCCFSQYHSIFRAVSYCVPVGLEAHGRTSDYSRVYYLEITRGEYDSYRQSGINWRDYIYGKYEELAPARSERPVFDRMPSIDGYHLPARYNLCCPTGISQVVRVNQNWFRDQCLAIDPGPWLALTGSTSNRRSKEWAAPLHAESLADLPSLIAGAAHFVTINSAPNIIASGVRSSWHQVYQPGFAGQDNYSSPGQIVLRQPADLATYSWRFWVHYWRRRLMGIDTSRDRT